MKPVMLVMTNQRGEELGRVAVGGYAVCGAGESDPTAVPDLRSEMDDLRQAVEGRVVGEGMELAVGPVEALIGISRALLASDAVAEVRITLPVRPAAERGSGAGNSAEAVTDLEDESNAALFADLFAEVAVEEEDR